MKKPFSGDIMSQGYKRIAIVTGATSGIGEATARKFVSEGFGVIGTGRRREKLEEMEKELGEDFISIAGEGYDESLLEKLFETAESRFGRKADIVVVNAGKGLGGSVTSADLDGFEEIWKINVKGALALMKKAALKMIPEQKTNYPRKACDIIVIGSVVGRHISPFSAVYGSTKFAVHSLAEGLRREVGPKGIRVSLVEPAVVISGFQDAAGYGDELVEKFHENFGPLLEGSHIADAISYIVSCPPHMHVSDMVVRPTRQDYP